MMFRRMIHGPGVILRLKCIDEEHPGVLVYRYLGVCVVTAFSWRLTKFQSLFCFI